MIFLSRKSSFFQLDLLILSTLSRRDCYGYELTSLIKENTEDMFDIQVLVMYPILNALSEKGYITSYEKVYNRRIRVYYHLEEQGKLYLTELIDNFIKKSELVKKYILEGRE